MILHSGFFGPRKSRRLCSFLFQHRAGKGTKKCFPLHTRTAAEPKGSPLPTLFFQKWEVVRFCAKLRMAKIAFPLSRTTDFENGRHHCTKATIQWAPHSQWSPTIKRVFSLSVPLKHTYEKKSHKKHIGRV